MVFFVFWQQVPVLSWRTEHSKSYFSFFLSIIPSFSLYSRMGQLKEACSTITLVVLISQMERQSVTWIISALCKDYCTQLHYKCNLYTNPGCRVCLQVLYSLKCLTYFAKSGRRLLILDYNILWSICSTRYWWINCYKWMDERWINACISISQSTLFV